MDNRDLKAVSGPFDFVVFRALGRRDEYIRELLRITRKGGVLAAYKGKRELIKYDLAAVEKFHSGGEIVELFVPFLEKEERNLLIFRL